MPAIELASTPLFTDPRLLAYWKLENVNDSKASYNLTNNGSIVFNAVKFNNGADGGIVNTTKHLSIDTTFGLATAAQHFTMCGWFQISTEILVGTQYLWEKCLATSGQVIGYQIAYEYNSGTRRLMFNRARHGAGDDKFYYNVALGTVDINHIGITYDGATLVAYLNGVAIGSISSTGAGVNDPTLVSRFALLASDNGYGVQSRLSGKVDDYALFNDALTAGEMLGLATGAWNIPNLIIMKNQAVKRSYIY